jgi:hypothetical protein
MAAPGIFPVAAMLFSPALNLTSCVAVPRKATQRDAMTDKPHFDQQLNLRLPAWLKMAVQSAADDRQRQQRGQRVTAACIAREVLWQRFESAAPKPQAVEVAQ